MLMISAACFGNECRDSYTETDDMDYVYIPYIEENKEWTYLLKWSNPWAEDHFDQVYKFAFDGTEELYGKEYHRIVNTELQYGRWRNCVQYLAYQEPKGVLAYLREEDKRV